MSSLPAPGTGAAPPAAADSEEELAAALAAPAATLLATEAEDAACLPLTEDDDGGIAMGMHQPTTNLDLTDASISQDVHLASDGGAWWQPPPAAACCRAHPKNGQMQPTHESISSVDRDAPQRGCSELVSPPSHSFLAGSSSSGKKRDAPCIVLPHQSDYVSHIALDIGAQHLQVQICRSSAPPLQQYLRLVAQY
jgi:hypothetical protein